MRGARVFAIPPPGDGVSPFLKWLGGKRWLIERGIRMPALEEDSTYFEPFLGAGSLYFAFRPSNARLSDVNSELIVTYQQLRDNVEDVITCLNALENNAETFNHVRASTPDADLERAVRFIYLNRTAYGGMYRVNLAGHFNVPFGNYTDRRLCQPAVLRAAASALTGSVIRRESFEIAASPAQRGDFVYFDPPYDSRSSRELFSRYTNSIFTWEMHQTLASFASVLANRGVHVLVSNTSHPDVTALYPDFECTHVKRKTQLSSDPTRRGIVEEAVFASYPGAVAD